MNKIVAGEDNLYFEMESIQATVAGFYENVPYTTTTATSEKKETPVENVKGASTEAVHSCRSDAVIVRRLLCVITAVVVVSFLTAVATSILALTMMMTRNAPTACVAIPDSQSSSVIKSDHRIARENITTLENRLEETVQNLTDRLESTQLELKTLKSLLHGQLEVIWMAANATAKQITNLTNKVAKELEAAVCFNFTQSRKCFTELKSSIRSLRENVTYRSNGFEVRIEMEEQKSNNTSQLLEQHSEKMQDLEDILNSTRQDVKEASQQYLTALWSAKNFTKRELHRVWTVVNTTQIGLNEKIMEVKHNLTEQKKKVQDNTDCLAQLDGQIATLWNITNSTTIHVNTLKSIWIEINATVEKTSSLTNKVNNEMEAVWLNLNQSRKYCSNLTFSLQSLRANMNNVSKMVGPIGPSGFNGSQGPAGPAGSVGPRGPKGAGDFSVCQYKVVTETMTPGISEVIAGLAERNGSRVLGAACSTNFAEEFNLLSILHNNVRRYSCVCKGSSTLFQPFGAQKSCFLHYWECPLTT